jgi:hypothetical protein
MRKQRVLIFEPNDLVTLRLFQEFNRPERWSRCEIIERRRAIQFDDPPMPESDVVILNPACLPNKSSFGFLPAMRVVRKMVPAEIPIVLHTDEWAFQEYRQLMEDAAISIRHGFVREDWKRMWALLDRLRPTP